MGRPGAARRRGRPRAAVPAARRRSRRPPSLDSSCPDEADIFPSTARSFSRARCSRMLAALGVMPRTTAISAGVSRSQAQSRSRSASSGRRAASASATTPSVASGPGADDGGGSRVAIRAARRCCRRAPGPGWPGSCGRRRTPTAAGPPGARRTAASRPGACRRGRRRPWPRRYDGPGTPQRLDQPGGDRLEPFASRLRVHGVTVSQPTCRRSRVSTSTCRRPVNKRRPVRGPGPNWFWGLEDSSGLPPPLLRRYGLRSPCRPCHPTGRPWGRPSRACRRRRPRW